MTRSFPVAIAVAASMGAAVVHLALGPEHVDELGALGLGFFLAAALQAGWAAAMIVARGEARLRTVGAAGIGINVAILGAWILSRTIGLPAGENPWVPESIGRADLITAALEVAVVVGTVVQLRARPAGRAGAARRPVLAMVLAVLAIAAGTGAAIVPDASHAATHEAAHTGSHEAMTGAESAP
jgi:hypothetical protein